MTMIDADEQTGTAAPGGRGPHEALGAVYDIKVRVSVVLGRATMPLSRLLGLGRGDMVELDRKLDDPVEIHVNDRLVARGEITVVDDHLAVTLTEMARGNG
jgi:flagellar motor switch protein FliN/FliY